MSGVFVNNRTSTFFSPKSKTQFTNVIVCSKSRQLCLSETKFKSAQLAFGCEFRERVFCRDGIRCNSSNRPGGPGSGDGESRKVLDAFFLGKALAEAFSERIESTVGEALSTIGRVQAEQQKQIQDFQADVFERAKKAKEKAARERLEAKGLISKPGDVDTPGKSNGVTVRTTSSPSPTSVVNPSNSTSSLSYAAPATAETVPDPVTEDPVPGSSDDDD